MEILYDREPSPKEVADYELDFIEKLTDEG